MRLFWKERSFRTDKNAIYQVIIITLSKSCDHLKCCCCPSKVSSAFKRCLISARFACRCWMNSFKKCFFFFPDLPTPRIVISIKTLAEEGKTHNKKQGLLSLMISLLFSASPFFIKKFDCSVETRIPAFSWVCLDVWPPNQGKEGQCLGWGRREALAQQTNLGHVFCILPFSPANLIGISSQKMDLRHWNCLEDTKSEWLMEGSCRQRRLRIWQASRCFDNISGPVSVYDISPVLGWAPHPQELRASYGMF